MVILQRSAAPMLPRPCRRAITLPRCHCHHHHVVMLPPAATAAAIKLPLLLPHCYQVAATAVTTTPSCRCSTAAAAATALRLPLPQCCRQAVMAATPLPSCLCHRHCCHAFALMPRHHHSLAVALLPLSAAAWPTITTMLPSSHCCCCHPRCH